MGLRLELLGRLTFDAVTAVRVANLTDAARKRP